ncbi:MAG TPA: hypothetical protein VEO54_05140 [Thermoanaerobaculia bacterium]|nr:hypothetical protein [Thermoanaerobaculia bacterium]
MRGVSTRVWVGAALVLVVLAVPAAWADDPPSPTDPPQSRMQPPVGMTAQARVQPPVGVTAQSRIQPPGGDTAESRLQPPVGIRDQNLVDLLLIWLRERAGILLP